MIKSYITKIEKRRNVDIKGQLQEIIYQNEINSYTIANFVTEEEEVTVVGYLPFIQQGDSLKLTGRYVEHQDYGKQFKIETFEKTLPETLGALECYLANGSIKGIGASTAKKIIATFQQETISIFRYEPEKLATIKGITLDKAKEMGREFNENWEVWELVGYLQKFGIGPENAKKVQKLLGNSAVSKIEENPYLLMEISHGVDFKTIDKMAMKIGIPITHEKRVQSAIFYGLNNITYQGHICTIQENLITYVCELISVPDEVVKIELINLKVRGEIVIEDREDASWVYLASLYEAEVMIAQKLLTLEESENTKKISALAKELQELENNSEIKLSQKQKEAIKEINKHNVCVITGGPGTGKTTIIKTIIDLYKKHKKKVVLCAPTGRAAKRMTETTGEEAKTLHRLLEIGKLEEKQLEDEKGYEVAPIDADIVIVDEVSMVDVRIMSYLLQAIYKGTKLILVGDMDQLPSVGPGSILEDIIQSGKVTTVIFDTIFRQAAKSKIIVNAHRINHGEWFIAKEEAKQTKEDFFYIREISQERIRDQVISLCTGRLKNFGDYDFFKNIQVISPTKKGILGTKELNKVLQEKLNPRVEDAAEKQSMGATFRQGDRIMQIRNNYDIYWEKVEKGEYGSGVFNGELGTIKKIREEEKQVEIYFDDDKIAWYAFSELDQIEHAYAITIHKAQRE